MFFGIVPSPPTRIGITVTVLLDSFPALLQGPDIFFSFSFILLLLYGLQER